jgi:hypothetical protein
MSDATTELIRVLGLAFSNFTVEDVRSRDWASATIIGVRHTLTFRTEGEVAQAAADRFLNDLAEAEFDLRGHIVADIALVSESRTSGPRGPLVRICIEALTVEAA